MLISSREQDVSRPLRSRGRGACECDSCRGRGRGSWWGGGLDFPLQPTEAQRTIQRFLWGRCQDCQLGAHSTSGFSLFLSKLWTKVLKSPQTDAPKSPILIFKRLLGGRAFYQKARLPSSAPRPGRSYGDLHPWCPAAGSTAQWSSGSPVPGPKPPLQASDCSPVPH